MKRIWLLAILVGVWPGAGMAQTTDELVSDGKNTDNVLTQSMGYDRKSPWLDRPGPCPLANEGGDVIVAESGADC